MSVNPLGKSSVLLVAPLDLYLTSISTLDVFEEGQHLIVVLCLL